MFIQSQARQQQLQLKKKLQEQKRAHKFGHFENNSSSAAPTTFQL